MRAIIVPVILRVCFFSPKIVFICLAPSINMEKKKGTLHLSHYISFQESQTHFLSFSILNDPETQEVHRFGAAQGLSELIRSST